MTIAQAALTAAVAVLKDAGVAGPARDARLLLADALGVDAGRITLILRDEVAPQDEARFMAHIARRAAREPLSHITGCRAFFGRDFKVSADVLDPRPETEILVETALGLSFETVLDLGTGSGCILLSVLAERPCARGIGADVSAAALGVAGENAARLNLSERAEFVRSDWFHSVNGCFDLIVSNPPYIAADEMAGLSEEVRRFEPAGALTPGGDGLDAYRTITANAARHLAPNGHLAVEIGPTQAQAVRQMFETGGFTDIQVIPDFDSRDRVVFGRKLSTNC